MLKSLLVYLKRYILFYLIGIIFLFAVDIVQLMIPQIIGNAIDGLKEHRLNSQNLLHFCFLIIVYSAVIFAGRFLWRLFIFGSSRKIEYHLRNELFGHLEKLSLNFFNKSKTGDLMAHLTNDVDAVRMAIGPGLMMAFDAIVMTVLVIARTTVKINIPLTLIAMIPMPAISFGALFIGRVLRSRFFAKQDAFAKLTDFVQETYSGIRVIAAFVQESRQIKAFFKINKYNMDKNISLINIYTMLFPLIEFIAGLSFLSTLLFGGYLTLINVITLGEFVAFIQYIEMLIWPLMAMGWCINIFSQGMVSQGRIQKILDEKPEITDSQALIEFDEIKNLKPEIELKNLTFTYESLEYPQLKDINLVLQNGKSLAIIGRTGSGKTTLVNLLARLYEPPENSIFLGGIDIRKIPLVFLRGFIGFVSQDNFLFSNTIKNNIAFGSDESCNENDIAQAARSANIESDIMELPDRYDTIVGERGITLSGGQKQRVCIARALLKDPPVLILDDALSSVDTKTEEEILKNIQKVRKDRITIIIAHRISTIQFADYILVLDNGDAAEYGTHSELLHKKGLYHNMYNIQKLEQELNGVDN